MFSLPGQHIQAKVELYFTLKKLTPWHWGNLLLAINLPRRFYGIALPNTTLYLLPSEVTEFVLNVCFGIPARLNLEYPLFPE